jgi:hypothetical protein
MQVAIDRVASQSVQRPFLFRGSQTVTNRPHVHAARAITRTPPAVYVTAAEHPA